jgi:putative ABC transport system ATP-binding protein
VTTALGGRRGPTGPPAPAGTPVIDLAGVSKVYPGPPPVTALDGIDLRVDRGEFVGIVGPSGSGKSTLLNLLGALDRCTSGRIRIDGTDLAGLDDAGLSAVRGRRIGFVFQNFNLLDGLSAVDNVGLGLVYAGVPAAERRERALAALDRVQLGHRGDHRPSRLSGGERQRVAIARAIVSDPALLLADEPTGNLDTATGEAVLDEFRRLHEDGATVILITHDPQLADSLPRRVTVRDGHIISDERTP